MRPAVVLKAMEKIKIRAALLAVSVILLLGGCEQDRDIHRACERGDLGKAKKLIRAAPELVHAKTKEQMTPLHLAAGKGHRELVALLIAEGAEVNQWDASGATPLTQAIVGGHLPTAEVLLKKGAKVDIKNRRGVTLLYEASLRGKDDVVSLLLKYGADVNSSFREARRVWHDKEGGESIELRGDWTPLLAAVAEGRHDMAKALIVAGADVNSSLDNGATPLHVASYQGRPEMVQGQPRRQDHRGPHAPAHGHRAEARRGDEDPARQRRQRQRQNL